MYSCFINTPHILFLKGLLHCNVSKYITQLEHTIENSSLQCASYFHMHHMCRYVDQISITWPQAGARFRERV